MNQLSFLDDLGRPTLDAARTAAELGMTQALEHAEDVVPKWGNLALKWIKRYARQHGVFSGEDCVLAAYEWGLVRPPDDRAWGWPFRNAAQCKFIERVKDRTAPRKRGHGSPGPLWRSLIVGVA